MLTDNPYAPPVSDLRATSAGLGRGRRGRVLWTVGFTLNLIIPGMMAWPVLTPPGTDGMAIATLFMLVIGLAALGRYPRLTRPAIAGAFLVAVTQVVPVLQLVVGGVAVEAACKLTGLHSPSGDLDDRIQWLKYLGLVPTFLATLLGGLTLMGISLALGWIVEIGLSGVAQTREVS